MRTISRMTQQEISDEYIIQRYNELKEKKMTEAQDEFKNVPCPVPVGRSFFSHVPYFSEPQEIQIHGCVLLLQIDAHFGEFELLDSANHILATSRYGKMKLGFGDLQTEEAKIWYTALKRTSKLYQFLVDQYKVKEPGLDLSSTIRPVSIRFINAPKNAQRAEHVPLYVRTTAIWNRETCCYLSDD